jgi:hypothetical protein
MRRSIDCGNVQPRTTMANKCRIIADEDQGNEDSYLECRFKRKFVSYTNAMVNTAFECVFRTDVTTDFD